MSRKHRRYYYKAVDQQEARCLKQHRLYPEHEARRRDEPVRRTDDRGDDLIYPIRNYGDNYAVYICGSELLRAKHGNRTVKVRLLPAVQIFHAMYRIERSHYYEPRYRKAVLRS